MSRNRKSLFGKDSYYYQRKRRRNNIIMGLGIACGLGFIGYSSINIHRENQENLSKIDQYNQTLKQEEENEFRSKAYNFIDKLDESWWDSSSDEFSRSISQIEQKPVYMDIFDSPRIKNNAPLELEIQDNIPVENNDTIRVDYDNLEQILVSKTDYDSNSNSSNDSCLFSTHDTLKVIDNRGREEYLISALKRDLDREGTLGDYFIEQLDNWQRELDISKFEIMEGTYAPADTLKSNDLLRFHLNSYNDSCSPKTFTLTKHSR